MLEGKPPIYGGFDFFYHNMVIYFDIFCNPWKINERIHRRNQVSDSFPKHPNTNPRINHGHNDNHTR